MSHCPEPLNAGQADKFSTPRRTTSNLSEPLGLHPPHTPMLMNFLAKIQVQVAFSVINYFLITILF